MIISRFVTTYELYRRQQQIAFIWWQDLQTKERSVESWLPKGCAQEMMPSLWQRKQSATFSSQVVFPPDYVKVKTGYWGNEAVGSGLVRKHFFPLQPSRPGGVYVCVCVENKEHLPIQNPPSPPPLPWNPDGAVPIIRQTRKGPWWKIWVRFPSCILVGPGGEKGDCMWLVSITAAVKHSGQAIELCCQSLWCKQLSLLH